MTLSTRRSPNYVGFVKYVLLGRKRENIVNYLVNDGDIEFMLDTISYEKQPYERALFVLVNNHEIKGEDCENGNGA